MGLEKSVKKFVEEKSGYYEKWIYNEPIIISKKHHLKLEKLQKVLFKIINEFVGNFKKYEDIIILNKKKKEILNELRNTFYNIGTYRTDFVYDNNKQPKLIEITCRFALNGLFLSAVINNHAKKFHKEKLKDVAIIDDFQDIFKYIDNLSGDGDIFILKGGDLKNESILFKDIFTNSGKNVVEVHFSKISSYVDRMKKGWIISELTIEEIESLDLDIIKKVSKLNITNDFRTAILIHDKQFFSALGNKDLQRACLSDSEIKFFEDFYIPTYHHNERPDLWFNAKLNKDNWILKHKTLGKSKQIFAGLVTSKKEWDNIFIKENLQDYVLQKWVPQTKVNGEILDKKYHDYITGTLLFFNNNYFGLGLFRTSSFPVTNVVDDRKASSLVIKEAESINKQKFTNYIDS